MTVTQRISRSPFWPRMPLRLVSTRETLWRHSRGGAWGLEVLFRARKGGHRFQVPNIERRGARRGDR